MAKPKLIVESIPIELGGKTRHLRLTIEAITIIKKEMGVDVTAGLASVADLELELLCDLIWALLIHEDDEENPEMYPDDPAARARARRRVQRWIGVDNMEAAATALAAAFGVQLPEPKDDPDPLPAASQPSRSTGSTSGQPLASTSDSASANSGN